MYPAFRSKASEVGFCLLIVSLLLLPFILPLVGLPSREEVYKAIPIRFGVPGREVEVIYRDHRDPDVVFLGSSLLMASIYTKPIESALSAHLGRPAYVTVLGMDWQGLDLQYFILRDLLQHHHPGLIVLNAPIPFAATDSPHFQTYRWFRYGEFSDDFTGVPLIDKAEIYGYAVLGGPRELLSRFRPNLLGKDETESEVYDEFLKKHRDFGYGGTAFIPEDDGITRGQFAHVLPPHSPTIKMADDLPAPYPLHFLRKILQLAEKNQCKVVFLHVPISSEYGDDHVTEYDWFQNDPDPYSTIGVPATTLFAGMSKERFLHYYSDNHMNANGSRLFTDAITPPLIEAYDESRSNAHLTTKSR